jgi:MMP 1-O-methyltransferase
LSGSVAREELHELLDGIPGWLTHEEGERLYELARACTSSGVIVEIGSFHGKSTICLGLGSKAGRQVPVYAIDPHRRPSWESFLANLERAGVADLVKPIRGRSQRVAAEFDEAVELLFIDGDHRYKRVLHDFNRWVPKVVEGGVVAMHDTTWFPGPKRVAEDRIFRSRQFKDAKFVFSSTTVARKVAENSVVDRLRNRRALYVKRSLELARRVADKDRAPLPLQRLGRRAVRALQGD